MDRFKRKVASRVIASLQQVAGSGASGATGSSQSHSQSQASAAAAAAALGEASAGGEPQAGAAAAGAAAQVLPEGTMSTSWFQAAKATAHLTDEERGILLEVFKKEEQFQRDTIK